MGKLTSFLKRMNFTESETEKTEDKKILSPRLSYESSRAQELEGLKEIKLTAVDRRILTYHEPESIVAENFKILRSHILHPRTGLPSKFVMITSAIPGEGKTFVAVNLAFSFARSVPTILVESDLRNASLTEVVEGPFEKGLSEALVEDAPLEEIVYKTDFSNLYIIPAGARLEEATDIFSSEKLVAFLDSLRQIFPKSFIIFDTSPVLLASEPLYLSRLVDGVLMVVRYAFSERDVVEEAIEKLGRAKILGLVFNGFNISSLNLISSRFKYYHISAKYYKRNNKK